MVSQNKAIGFTAFGACLEWFEFSLYAYLAPYLAEVFFPRESVRNSLIAVFGVFAAGYIMRPLGGIVFGYMGDKLGRKKALLTSISLMAVPMGIMVVVPSYHTIGLAAVVILVIARLLQGFSIGGEYTSVLVMLIELAPARHRAFVTALASLSSSFGVTFSAMLVATLSAIFSDAQMSAWGWRIAFGVGLGLTLTSFFLQSAVAESPIFAKAPREPGNYIPLMEALRKHKFALLVVFVLTGSIGIFYYMVATYIPNQLIGTRSFDKSIILWITTACALVYALSSPLWGACADRFGRKPVLLIPISLLAILGYPAFIYINNGSLWEIFGAEMVLMILIAAATASFQTTISELFPSNQRCSGVSASYNISNALFAGTTPMIAATLVSATDGNEFAPAIYMVIAAIISVAVLLGTPETRTMHYLDQGAA